jgi:hypothetical protein
MCVGDNRRIDPRFLQLGTSLRLAGSFTPLPLNPLTHWTGVSLGGPQSRSGPCADENCLDPTGTTPPTLSVVEPVVGHYTDCSIQAL